MGRRGDTESQNGVKNMDDSPRHSSGHGQLGKVAL